MMVINLRSVSSALLMVSFAVCGCKSPSKATTATEPATPSSKLPAAAVAVDPAVAGTITGVVSFKGAPPARVKIDMSMDPACAMSAEDNYSEQYVIKNGKVANVFVYLKRGVAPTVLPDTSAPGGTEPIRMDQKGCRFIPHVAAIQQGAAVIFSNSDPTMHNVHTMAVTAGNANIDVSQGPGATPELRRFNTAENMLPIRCNNHPWMSAFLNVAPNPYFSLSGADGKFTLRGLPPGKYIVAAVHEKLGEQDVEVDVPAHGNSQAEFTFGPQPGPQ